MLIVTQTAENQERVARLLDTMRRLHEARAAGRPTTAPVNLPHMW